MNNELHEPHTSGAYRAAATICPTIGWHTSRETLAAIIDRETAAPELLVVLELAIARVQIANKEGNMILSAWLPSAQEAIAKATKPDVERGSGGYDDRDQT